MTNLNCAPFRRMAGAFVDGELTGAERLRFARHLDSCGACSDDVQAFRRIGEVLRNATYLGGSGPLMDGLASQVVSRTRAESAESWRSVLSRAGEDWHWLIVGGGSVAATFVSALCLTGMLAFGPRPKNHDSLESVLAMMDRPAGALFVNASAPGLDVNPAMYRVDSNGDGALSAASGILLTASERDVSDADDVRALDDLLTRNGRIVSLDALSVAERRYAEGLLDVIQNKPSLVPVPVPVGAQLDVHSLLLRVDTDVPAKGS